MGAYIPHELASYLSLYAMVFGCSKTKLIKDSLTFKRLQLEEGNPISRLKEKAIIHIRSKWKAQSMGNSDLVAFSVFKAEVRTEMEKSGIEPDIINDILKEI